MNSAPSVAQEILRPELLLEAYCQGIFPMGMENGEIGWFSPNPRGILPLDDFRVPHGLRRTLSKRKFEIRINHDFVSVMEACGRREETWISPEIVASYTHLHKMGFAHSVEAWNEKGLVGGLYGVSIGGAFFGESMFHIETDASKVALEHLVHRMKENGFSLLDIQWTTPHLETFGAIAIPKKEYLARLKTALRQECRFDGKLSSL